MKTKIFNYDRLDDLDINDKVIRVKAIMINKKREVLLEKAFGTMQFPGGHLEEGENLNEALKREILEETGIVLNQDYKAFLSIKYYLKDYPVKGNNRSIELYYFYIETDEIYNLDNIHLDDQERNGNFTLFYLPLIKLKKALKINALEEPINKLVTKEMLLALKTLKREKLWKVKNSK